MHFAEGIDLRRVIILTDVHHSQVEQVKLLDRFSNKTITGTLHLTATHLIFVESNSTNAQEIWVRERASLFYSCLRFSATSPCSSVLMLLSIGTCPL